MGAIANKCKKKIAFIVKKLSENRGFTLIEAVITVAIVGIIIVPISTIFIGSLQSTVEAKEQMRANELAQMYIENLKVRSYEDLNAIFPAGDKTTISALDIDSEKYLNGLPAAMEGYVIVLSKDDSIYDVPDYKVEKPADELESGDVDLIVDIYESDLGVPTIDFSFVSVSTPLALDLIWSDDLTGGDVTYNVTFNESDQVGVAKETVDQGTKKNMYDLVTDDMIVNVTLEDDISIPNVNIEIIEQRDTTATAFVFREGKDLVNPIIDVGEGIVSSEYNILYPNPAEYFMSTVQVLVYRDIDYEQLVDPLNVEVIEPLTTMNATIVFD